MMMFCVDSKDCAKVQKNPLMAKHIFIFFASPGVYLSALSARFSAARDEGRQKQPSGGEKPQFFIGKRRKLQIPWAESPENGENRKFRGQNWQKTAKTANSVDRIGRKRRNLQIPWTESSEIDENCVSPPWRK